MRDREGEGRLDGPLGLIRTGVVDALLHIVAGRVEHILIGHITDNLAVHLNGQRVGLGNSTGVNGKKQAERRKGQQIHRHPGQKLPVAPDAADEVAAACPDCCAEALLLPDAVCVDQQGTDAPEEQVDGAENVLEELGSPRERDDRQIAAHRCRGMCHHEGGVSDPAPQPHRRVFGCKAQCVKQFAQRQQQRRGTHFGREAVHVVLGLAAEPMAAQQTAALDLRPARPQLFAARFHRQRRGLLVLPGLLCLFVNQKGMLLPAIHSGSMAMACPLPRADTKMLSFIIHFRPDETRFVTKIGRYFHVLFTLLS